MASTPRPWGSDIARIAVFAALIIALGLISLQMPGGVPITGQTLGVMLAGLILGPRRGALAVLTVLVLAAIGLPVLAGGRGGIGVFVGPSAGYLVGFVVGAAVIGLIAGSGRITAWRAALASVVGGMVVIYLFGIPVQSLVTGVPLGPTALSSLVFLPGDLIKVVVATLLCLALQRAYPRAFGRKAVRVA